MGRRASTCHIYRTCTCTPDWFGVVQSTWLCTTTAWDDSFVTVEAPILCLRIQTTYTKSYAIPKHALWVPLELCHTRDPDSALLLSVNNTNAAPSSLSEAFIIIMRISHILYQVGMLTCLGRSNYIPTSARNVILSTSSSTCVLVFNSWCSKVHYVVWEFHMSISLVMRGSAQKQIRITHTTPVCQKLAADATTAKYVCQCCSLSIMKG